MKEQLEKEISLIREQIEELDSVLRDKNGKLRDILIDEEVKKYNSAEDKFNYLCFESTFDRGNIPNSKNEFVVSKLWQKELAEFISCEGDNVSQEYVKYLFDVGREGVIVLNFTSESIKETHVQKVVKFIEGNWASLVEKQKELKKDNKLPLDCVMLDPMITDFDRGCERLVVYSNGKVKQMRMRYSSLYDIYEYNSLMDAYESLKKGITEEENDY